MKFGAPNKSIINSNNYKSVNNVKFKKIKESNSLKMAATEDVFELKCILKNCKIRLCARIESGVKQLLALITR